MSCTPKRNRKKKHKTKLGVITCLPSTVSKLKNFSSQSPSRGRPSSHNSPFTLQTNAPFALRKQKPLTIVSDKTTIKAEAM